MSITSEEKSAGLTAIEIDLVTHARTNIVPLFNLAHYGMAVNKLLLMLDAILPAVCARMILDFWEPLLVHGTCVNTQDCTGIEEDRKDYLDYRTRDITDDINCFFSDTMSICPDIAAWIWMHN